ncbi:uncharacterized protein ARMOST_02037 [Armillaria ostoyae]|uniref:Uncharacterized protein n=1 Tax=Armillaria ostoyae TaxID=47428 RepID=A0A284QQN9_ARMOS|nr:uncharacterized protein ARMOST_02037 [Armillaria ostoyae]
MTALTEGHALQIHDSLWLDRRARASVAFVKNPTRTYLEIRAWQLPPDNDVAVFKEFRCDMKTLIVEASSHEGWTRMESTKEALSAVVTGSEYTSAIDDVLVGRRFCGSSVFADLACPRTFVVVRLISIFKPFFVLFSFHLFVENHSNANLVVRHPFHIGVQHCLGSSSWPVHDTPPLRRSQLTAAFASGDLFRLMLIFIQGLFLSITCVRSQTSSLRTIPWCPPTSQTLTKRTTKHPHPTIASLEIVTNLNERVGRRRSKLSILPLEVSGESLAIISSSGIGCHQLPYSTVPSLTFLLPAPYLEEFGDHRIDFNSRRLIHSAYSLINITSIASTTIFLLFAFCDLVARL